MNRNILISGGGIAGCTLAYFLRHRNFHPVVVESAPAFKHVGYLLAINKQIGQRVAEKMGVLDRLKQFEVLLTNNIIVDSRRRPIMRVTTTPELVNENTGLMLNRADLHLTLYDTIKDDVEFHFGREISRLTQDARGVDVAFSDGSTNRFDLVVGADGVDSNTRTLLFGSGCEKYLDIAYFEFTVPNRIGQPVAGVHDLVMMGARTSSLPITPSERRMSTGTYSTVRHRTAPRTKGPSFGPDEELWKVRFDIPTHSTNVDRQRFCVSRLVYPDCHAAVDKGRVCLLGDAAYRPTPAAGTGASLAMAGAYVLARKLAGSNDYNEAFAAYDAYVRPYAAKAQKSAIGQAKVITGRSPLPYGLTNAILRALPASVLTFLLTKLHSHRLEMPLP